MALAASRIVRAPRVESTVISGEVEASYEAWSVVPEAPASDPQEKRFVVELQTSLPVVASQVVDKPAPVIPVVDRVVRPEDTVKPDPNVTKPLRVSAVLVVAPLPVTVARVSDSEVKPEPVIVIVEPDVLTVLVPEPFIVSSPVVSFRLLTSASSASETMGFWPPVTSIPSPPVTE